MVCLNLNELRGLQGAERASGGCRKEDRVCHRERQRSAGRSGLDLELTQRGLITTLIVTTASFAALYNKSVDKEALAFKIMRCMAEALFDVMAFSSQEDLERRLNLPKR